MRTHTFSNVYVFQRYTVDAETGKLTIREGDDLGPDYVLETVKEERLALLTVDRISRVKEILKGSAVLTKPEADRVVPKDKAEIEKERQAYYENFFRQLP